MKRFLLLPAIAAALICAKPAAAQLSYNITTQTGQAYTPLTGGTSINNGLIWDEEDFCRSNALLY